jgi:predicted Zn-dependent protease
MQTDFNPTLRYGLAHRDCGGKGCGCGFAPQRRLFTRALVAAGAGAALPALAQRDGIDVGQQSQFSKLVPAEQVEQAATQQYSQLLREARAKNALGPDNHPQVVRLRAIAQRLIPHTDEWNPRARGWKWEVNLIGSKQINAFCMPGGKIAFFYGILDQLKISDDEVAMIMGHEMAHALREHARERMGKTAATRIGAGVLSALLGLGSTGDAVLNMGGQLLTLKFSREDESEADLVGMDIGARGGYDPRGGVSLWQKMMNASKGAPPEFLSTHPSGTSRIKDIEANLPRVMPIYERSAKPSQRYAPPAANQAKAPAQDSAPAR